MPAMTSEATACTYTQILQHIADGDNSWKRVAQQTDVSLTSSQNCSVLWLAAATGNPPDVYPRRDTQSVTLGMIALSQVSRMAVAPSDRLHS